MRISKTSSLAGIYLHVPFCKQACHYCDFHFSTSLRYRERMVAALIRELELRQREWQDHTIDTIYFGGGTPSMLRTDEITQLLDRMRDLATVAPDAEITLEANPDDLTEAKLAELAATGVNRLSIGIQSFYEEDLRFFNRAHNAEEAERCVRWARAAGFENLTIDLIYGSPSTPDDHWRANLDRAFALDVPHLSCYCLTVEEGTALAHFVKTGRAQPVDEDRAARHFDLLLEQTAAAGYEQYEISNFARPGWYSRHNSAYWTGTPYVAIGPSAHGFDGTRRYWNIRHNARYMTAIETGELPQEIETLSMDDRYNEYVLTALRTKWGVTQERLRMFGAEQHFLQLAQPYLEAGKMERTGDAYRLTAAGKFLADGIAAVLFR